MCEWSLPPPPALVARRKCEDKLKVLEATQGTLERQAREAKESFSTLSEDLRLITINWDKLVQEKGSVEVWLCGVGIMYNITREKAAISSRAATSTYLPITAKIQSPTYAAYMYTK